MQAWAAHGRTKPLPVWNTETGPTSRTFYRHVPDKLADSYTNWLRPVPCDRAAEDALKLFVLALAGGAERYFQYWCVSEESLLPRLGAMTIFEYDAALRPMAVAYAVAGSLLDGMRGQGWLDLPGPARASLLKDDHRFVAVLWRTTGRRPCQLALPYRDAKLVARNLMGNPVELKPRDTGCELPIGSEPLYLIVPGEQARSLLDALKNSTRIAQ